ncbi:DUF1998 domain-containing protein [Brevibacillus nitrificans]|uniref:DUF1998 domain-containing protein n=1 Tax=Brevibacillus nitrificans TaxID=651560 RepID=A0A3M8D787_9BACL|nr:DUF1998 domain-containing protein [Brevibacillus nitrificans]RNB83882.1 DUF1998 domain-containing protein [Brevibacillus nitrificans]
MQKRTIRRTQLISPWGVGQMINFPGDESLMVCGLDAWDRIYQSANNGSEEFIIREERLERRLGVSHFRIPPEYRQPGAGVKNPNLKIPCVRFPRWHYCPRCGSMEKLSLFGSQQKCKGPSFSDGMSCHNLPERKRPYLIPVRFIAICEMGHIEDFPFMEWVHTDRDHDSYCNLRLRAGRSNSSLSGILIHCSCTAKRSLFGAFNEGALSKIKLCSGHRPWLGEGEKGSKECGIELRVVQKGASNVYFPDTRSSIYLPQWEQSTDRKVVEILETYWDKLTSHRVDGQLNKAVFEMVAEMRNVDCNKLMTAAEKKLSRDSETNLANDDSDSEEMYRKLEYDAILSGAGGDNQDFSVTNKNSSEYGNVITRYFKSISLLHKLRETRAMVGFSRWTPEDGRPLYEKKEALHLQESIDWLPAIVVRGEGLFFEFDSQVLNSWLEKRSVHERAQKLADNYNAARRKNGWEEEVISPKFILLHTFAHILINQFSFECGYGSSALRERIYCENEYKENPMHGVLIYTASGDSEGSLGGLVRQGLPGNLENILINALHNAKWCSSDPVCMESAGQGPDSCNLAACHSCALLPETSCEESNKKLDRALLSGTHENADIGYFAGFDES